MEVVFCWSKHQDQLLHTRQTLGCWFAGSDSDGNDDREVAGITGWGLPYTFRSLLRCGRSDAGIWHQRCWMLDPSCPPLSEALG